MLSYTNGVLVVLGLWVVLLTVSLIKGKLNEKAFGEIIPTIIFQSLLSWIGVVIVVFAIIVTLKNKNK